ncbi:putative spore coat protein s, putative [Heliomicrobium modesticaldum Ice1]|uniref:Spore coat protein s, putative n=1 Tax=Heliobacterium modesticaldum (strain ATCC 51547 / Ice1) TaxID=498761 RepID=B0TAC5_HELMI|nr:CotS family spore coat protein [Heliomicrobium modesticaldum]ABZ84975.1 putative spore coat protein s, putative [Heliomicrobium modesticaldum Ice1]
MAETAEQLVELIRREYGLHVRAIQRLTPVWRLETDIGPLCLKRVGYDEGKLGFICAAMEHLRRQGFTRSPVLLPSREGRLWIPDLDMRGDYRDTGRDGWLFLTDWVADRPCNFSEEAHILAAAATLAEFHQYAKGLTSPDLSRRRGHWMRWPRLLAGRTADLHRYETLGARAPIERELLKTQIRQAQRALAVLERSEFGRIAAASQMEKTFVHRDIAARNFVLNYRDEAHLIDFDYCRCDLHLVDIARLLERVLRYHRWSYSLGQKILSVYEETTPLQPSEYPVLLAFLLFPQRFWRLYRRRYDGFISDASEFSRDLRQLQAEQRQKGFFLRRFAEEYCWGFLHRHGFDCIVEAETFLNEEGLLAEEGAIVQAEHIAKEGIVKAGSIEEKDMAIGKRRDIRAGSWGLAYRLELYKRFFKQS